MDSSRPRYFSRRRIILPLLLALSLLALAAPPAMAAHDSGPPASEAVDPSLLGLDKSQIDPNAPDLDYVWQNGYTAEGVSYSGFLRLRARPGSVWQRGHLNNGVWTPPHWVPTRNRADFIWVRGHRGPDGYWIFGHWRPVRRPGFAWAERRVASGLFIAGHWKPIQINNRNIWVRGYPTPNGKWTPGFWRPKVNVGFVWRAGRFRYGRWTSGYWVPIKSMAGFVWVPGHRRSNKYWVKGHWRSVRRIGRYWRQSHWSGGVWLPGGWITERPRSVVRRYHVYRVPAIQAHRGVRVRKKFRRHRREEREHRRKGRGRGRRKHREEKH